MKIKDSLERERAIDPGYSFIVQAPAGSGKTELLMQRFLRLLAIVERPEEILALTFTRKAAGEMQNRILGSIEKAKAGAEGGEPHEKKTIELARRALEADRARGWGLLDNPGRLKVQTIDSFCASIVRLTPLLSGMGVLPRITEKPEELYMEAARRTIELVEVDGEYGDAVRDALRHLDNSVAALCSRLVAMLRRRDQWKRHVGRVDANLRGLLEGSLKRLVEQRLKEVESAFPKRVIASLLELAPYSAANLLVSNPNHAAVALANIRKLPAPVAEDLRLWKGIRALLLTDKNGLRKPFGVDVRIGFPASAEGADKRQAFKDLLQGLADETAFIETLSEVSILPEPSYSAEEWEILSSILRLLPIAEGKLMEVFAERGSVDFQAVSMAALSALGQEDDPTELMLALDMKLKHILVDEYQDTSQTQLCLLKALTRGWEENDGRTLFAVGDPMQSIYMFREAEVGLFLDAKINGIGNIRLAPLRLSTNFRSGEEIVEWVNGAFSPAFPQAEDIFTGSIPYAPSIAAKKGGGGKGVEIRLYRTRDDESEANRVVSLVKAVDKGESVAILCRSRSHLYTIVEAMRKEGLVYRAQELDPLADRYVVRDLFALVRAITHPYDRVAWLSVLRAPWCGLTLADLHSLCAGDGNSPIWTLLNYEGRIRGLSEDGRARAAAFMEKMRGPYALHNRVPVRELLEGLWIDLNGPACVEGSSLMEDAEAFLALVDEASGSGAPNLIKDLEERMEGLYASHTSEETSIDLMTVHKAKGLEFDHVVLPGLGRPPRNEEKRLLFWMERGGDLFLAPIERKDRRSKNPVYDFLNELNRRKLDLERTRAFYVAATRARKSLLLLGNVNEDDGVIKADGRSFLSSINGSLTEDMLLDLSPAETEDGRAPGIMLTRLPGSWKAPLPKAPLEAVEAAEPAERREPEFYWAGGSVRHLGTVVHRYFRRMAKEGPGRWSEEKIKKERERMKAMLLALGVNRDEARRMALECAEVLCKALGDPRGRWILEGQKESSVELPITGVVKGKVARVVIDRTFVDDKDRRWVIDYKTSRHEGGALDEFLKSEKERYRLQLERYADILISGGETREIKRGIYYPALGAWIEW
ncbi:MAG: UvrD-helicase domain-containing protein [Deltaproteobacteria bacterium]|nr:UvrD-helicase domain-containing protein [Deltaproteobacteria bacterium]